MEGFKAVVKVLVGFFADQRGRGVAYARLTAASSERLLRLEFKVARSERFREHGTAYAALTAVVRTLARRQISHAKIVIDDAQLVEQIVTGSGVDEKLAIAYVRLRCALNSLAKVSFQSGATADLTQRAQAEVALNLAA